jgi:uncharacterized DUF497 family protein
MSSRSFAVDISVAHADRDDTIRIISARKTTGQERKHYEEEKES